MDKIILSIPKAELHQHLDGSLRPSTLIELSKKESYHLPSYDEKELKKIIFESSKKDLTTYLSTFKHTCAVMQTYDNLKRVTQEQIEDWSLDGVVAGEIRFCPYFHMDKGLSLEEVINAVLEGAAEASVKFKIPTGIIISGIRFFETQKNIDLINLAIKYSDLGVVAFDMAGDESKFPMDKNLYSHVQKLKNETKLGLTLHAGEADGLKSISDSWNFKPYRIGHGVRIIEDFNEDWGDLSSEIRDKQIPLEICLTSNEQTRVFKENHSFGKLYKDGFNTIISTDNRLISDVSLSDEYLKIKNMFNLSYDDLKKIGLNSIKALFMDEKEKKILIEKNYN